MRSKKRISEDLKLGIITKQEAQEQRDALELERLKLLGWVDPRKKRLDFEPELDALIFEERLAKHKATKLRP